MSSIEDFAQMDKDGIVLMFRSMNRPGGLNANGDRNPGLKVSAQAQINFADMCYFLEHQTNRVDRVATHAMVTLVAVRKLKTQRQQEDAHENPTVIPVVDFKNWPKAMESLAQYIRGHRGVLKGPLSYVTRRDLFPMNAVTDPGYNTAGSKYNDHDDEIIAWQRIVDASAATLSLKVHEKDGPFTDNFLLDRTRVFELLSSILCETDAWTVIKPFRIKRDGRGAWLMLWDHYLGENNVDHMAMEAEKALTTCTYKGESRNWNFEKYSISHLKNHGILEGLEMYGYKGIDKRSKVRYLTDGIKTKALDAVKTRIMLDSTLKSDFDGCVTLFKDFIRSDDYQGERNISAVDSGDTKKATIEDDRYIPKEEWSQMSSEQRAKIVKARADRRAKSGGKGGGKRDDKTPTRGKKRTSKIAKMVKKAVDRKVAAIMAKTKTTDDDSGADDEPEETLEKMNDLLDGHRMRQGQPKKKKSGN